MSVVRRAQPWLGTRVEIGVHRSTASTPMNDAIDAAFGAIARVHRAMSAHDPISDVTRFNAAPDSAEIDCDPWTVRCLRVAQRLHERTEGRFDVTLGTARVRPWTVVSTTRVRKHGGAVRIDLGGIAKGFAVDRAACTLRAWGVHDGWVDAGGDLRVLGMRPLRVAVRDWRTPQRAAWSLELARGSFASSQYIDGRSPSRGDALIDPRVAREHREACLVSVAARTCVIADGLTKVVALMRASARDTLTAFDARAWIAP